MESVTKTPSAPASASNAGTATARTLTIDGMTGDACVQRVRGVLKTVPDVTTQGVEVGAAHITADQPGCDAACKSVEGAGYKCRAGNMNDKSGGHAGSDANNETYKGGIGNAAAPRAKPAAVKH